MIIARDIGDDMNGIFDRAAMLELIDHAITEPSLRYTLREIVNHIEALRLEDANEPRSREINLDDWRDALGREL